MNTLQQEAQLLAEIKDIVHQIYMDEDLMGGAMKIKKLLATARAEGAAEERERIDKRIVELKELHQQLLDRFEQNRLEFKRNPDSISAKERVKSDENNGYICEVWGRLNELEALITKEIDHANE